MRRGQCDEHEGHVTEQGEHYGTEHRQQRRRKQLSQYSATRYKHSCSLTIMLIKLTIENEISIISAEYEAPQHRPTLE